MTESGTPGDQGAPSGGWAAPPPPTPAAVAGPAGFVYGDVPNRVIAFIIDAIILFVINFVVSILLTAIGFNPYTVSGTEISVNFIGVLLYAVIGLAISLGYFVYMWTKQRGTIGMRALGLQIGNAGDGATMPTDQGVRRWLAMFAPLVLAQVFSGFGFVGFFVALAGLAWVIFLLYTTAKSPTKQGWHDVFANTMVVKAARVAG